ncbi:hypothetical protein MAH1_34810 [Sessilibacter sp. MAH1]
MTKNISETSQSLELYFNDNGSITIGSKELPLVQNNTNQIKNAMLFNLLNQFEKDQEIPKEVFETLAILLKFSQLLAEDDK